MMPIEPINPKVTQSFLLAQCHSFDVEEEHLQLNTQEDNCLNPQCWNKRPHLLNVFVTFTNHCLYTEIRLVYLFKCICKEYFRVNRTDSVVIIKYMKYLISFSLLCAGSTRRARASWAAGYAWTTCKFLTDTLFLYISICVITLLLLNPFFKSVLSMFIFPISILHLGAL